MFEALRECGVLFEDASAAAQAVEERGEDLEDWWQSENVQTAISRLRDYNTRTSRFWLLDWMKAIPRL